MILKHFIKHVKKNFFLKKKLIIFGGLGILILVGGIIVANSDSMFSSVLNLTKIAQQRKLDFSEKQKIPLIKNTCIDTDGGIDYEEKWTITVVVSWYQRVEQDSCNPNGTLREWFCGQPGDPAGLLRSENYVDCEYGCYDGVCITTWVLKDVAIEWGTFVASDSQHANIEINLRNVWTTSIHTDGIWHGLSLDGNTYVDYWVAYDFWLLNNSNTILQPNETYTIFANVTLMGNNYFSNNSYININVSTYPDTDDIPSNNSYNLYLTGNFSSSTGQIVDCTTPENILNCNLWLPSCPPECTGQIVDCNTPENILACNLWLASCPPQCTGMVYTWIGDLIIEQMYITPNNTPTVGSNNDSNKINLVIKNIGNGSTSFPFLNWGNRISLWCYYPNGNGWFLTTTLSQTTLLPNQSITTQLNEQWLDYYGRFSTTGTTFIRCEILSQQQQGRSNTDPNNTQLLYESDGTNNSFILDYEVMPNKSTTLSSVKTPEIIKLK